MRSLCLMLCLGLNAWATELVELQLPKSNQITVKYMFKVGSVDDPKGMEGLANLAASTIFGGGTKSMTKQELDNLQYPMAAGSFVSVGKEAIVMTASVHKDHLDKFYSAVSDLLYAPRFDQADFDRIKKGLVKSVTEDIPNNNDEVLSKRILDTLLFQGHPYEHLIEGTEAALNKMTLDDVKAFYKKYFTQANVMVGMAGGYDNAFKKRVMDDLKKLPKGKKYRKAIAAGNMPKGTVVRIISKPNTFGSAIFMGYPLKLDRSSDDFAALMVANSYLGEHRKSYGQLYSKMRSLRSLNYGDYSYIEWYPAGHATQLPLTGYPRSANFFSIWIRPVQIAKQFAGVEGLKQPELGNGHFVIRQSIRELQKLIDSGLKQEDFERTRNFLKGYLKLYVQSQSSRLGFLMDSRFYGRKDYINDMIAQLNKLKLDDVNSAIRKHFQTENMFVAVITDSSEAEKLAESLRSNGSAPIVYSPLVSKGLPKEVTEEDKEIDRYRLNISKVEVVDSATLFRK